VIFACSFGDFLLTAIITLVIFELTAVYLFRQPEYEPVEPGWLPEYDLLALYNSLRAKGYEPTPSIEASMQQVQDHYDKNHRREP
jgi:hypothetical protein